jgi:hypothetical protein
LNQGLSGSSSKRIPSGALFYCLVYGIVLLIYPQQRDEIMKSSISIGINALTLLIVRYVIHGHKKSRRSGIFYGWECR